jgi:hypothetical protein
MSKADRESAHRIADEILAKYDNIGPPFDILKMFMDMLEAHSGPQWTWMLRWHQIYNLFWRCIVAFVKENTKNIDGLSGVPDGKCKRYTFDQASSRMVRWHVKKHKKGATTEYKMAKDLEDADNVRSAARKRSRRSQSSRGANKSLSKP